MTAYGIDVSSQQSATVDRPGVSFTIVKATEGHTYINPSHRQQVATARAAGHVVGHYHFLHPGDVQTQAQFFVTQAQAAPGDLLALDWETCEDGSVASSAEKDAFLRAVQSLGRRRTILYCNRDFWHNRDTSGFAGDGLWIADPDSPAGHPAVSAPWLFHQYGEDGGVDLDVYNGDDHGLRAWAGALPPAPTGPGWPGEYLKLQPEEIHDDNVRVWQQQMRDGRHWPITVDGWFGPQSDRICRTFQTDSNGHGWPLMVDGVVGPSTWYATWARPVTLP